MAAYHRSGPSHILYLQELIFSAVALRQEVRMDVEAI